MMKFLILLLSLINIAPNYANTISQFDDRIINGEDAPIEEFKYTVFFEIKNSFLNCGGTIVDNQYIITAAHCAIACIVNICDCSIRAGAANYTQGIRYNVADAKIHPKYNPISNEYDGALLKLCTPMTFSSTIGAIPFSSPTSPEIPTGATCAISGWGVTETGDTSDILKYAIVYKVDTAQCNESYSGGIYDSMICAAAPKKDTCQGDSGGPLIVSNVLAGITSWGNGCAQPDYPGVYTNVKVLSPWFIDTINKMKSNSGPYLACSLCIGTKVVGLG